MITSVDSRSCEKMARQLTIALLIALAITVHMFEFLLPSPLPGFRPGMANILTVTVLFLFGGREAWIMTIFRICLGSFLLGTLFSPTFLLALSGGVLSITVMCWLRGQSRDLFSPIGISTVGAVAHVVGQLIVARWIVVQHEATWSFLPPLLILAVVTGVINGYLAIKLIKMIGKSAPFLSTQSTIQKGQME